MSVKRRSICKIMRRLAKDQSGTILIKTALMMPVLLGFTALGVDVGMWYYEQRRMQTAADAAALAAAYVLNREGGTYSEYQAAAFNDAAANGFIHNVNAQVTVPASATGTAVDVRIDAPGDLYFSSLILNATPNISVDAAASGVGGTPCMIALHPTQPSSVLTNGSPVIIADGCDIHVNSHGNWGADFALEANGNPYIQADAICVNGKWSELEAAYSTQPHHCPPIPDPLANLPPPPVDALCADDGNPQGIYNGGPFTLSPGTYCYGFDIRGGTSVTLLPGIYVLKDEGIRLTGSANLYADGVMFYLTGSDPVVDLRGTGDLLLRSPASGTYEGILLFQDRSMTPGVDHYFRGDTGSTYRGTIYLATQDVIFVGNSNAVTETPFMTIVSTFNFDGTADWTYREGESGQLPILLRPRISLVE